MPSQPRPSVPSVDELRPPSGGLRFLEPTDPDPTIIDPASLPAVSPWEEPEGSGSTSPSSEAGDDEAATSDAPTSSPASSGDLFDDELLVPLARGLVSMAGDELHETFARDQAAQMVQMWKTDAGDDEAIGDPLASIVKRHAPAVDGLGSDTDAADGIRAMVGLAIYAVKQFAKFRAARKLRALARQAAAAAAAAGGDDGSGTPAPTGAQTAF